MQRFPLGRFSVSRIGFGAIQLPGRGAFGPPRDRGEAVAVLRRAVELGVDHIDTAQFYGPQVSNELIREALHPYPTDLALVSKVGARRDESGGWIPLTDAADFRSDIEANLRSLGVDQLAAVNLRLIDSDRPDERFDELLSVMIAARDAGLIGAIGLSNITREHLLHALQRTEIACVQNAFSLVNRSSEPVLRECTARGIAFVPFFTLRSPFAPPDQVLGHELVVAAAARLGCTPAQVASAWILSLAPNVLMIPGTSSVRHLEENLAVADIELDDETREQLTAVTT
ncbi:MAG: aldo/keto reductase [Mycobacterium sp.]|uniref:aldo/keto reductase n=1 Tax=Mycobacterium sp. TaxID=1785 RepID=UPI001EBF3591|nr:aldo/keto reductase [Mycobacterium sp.]MBW0017336.1 aldo/keto reductase [Mycobacterium sp.]